MEKLVARLESFVSENEAKPESSQDLAARLREALASNTIGGSAGDESKWRGMADEVREAQSSFSRLVPVPGETGKELAERFHKAVQPVLRSVPPQGPAAVGRAAAARPAGRDPLASGVRCLVTGGPGGQEIWFSLR